MTPQVFRLPTGVECSSNNGKISVSGFRGEVAFASASKLYRKGNIVIFSPYLTSYYGSIFTQAVLGVILGYTIELRLKGIGYRVREEEGKLVFSLGYSQPVVLTIPKEVDVEFGKKTFYLKSVNYSVLRTFVTTIRRYRFPDSYKGGGVLYEGEVIKCKEGKKT